MWRRFDSQGFTFTYSEEIDLKIKQFILELLIIRGLEVLIAILNEALARRAK
ncbi:hypothetical protein TUMSATVNIG3_26310 [Vibrio nigripulchritudo]|nr:hypothetical protein TUMSATVNIG2_25790 [Vibrio nigripulchritudo]BDU43833.1 hypothetical protein TUMSATVNIG3_26310 [Vibrio nigripulchritudo]